MRAIIEIDLPNSCADCPLEVREYAQIDRYCIIEGLQAYSGTEKYTDSRAPFCPLKIILSEKYPAKPGIA